MRLRSPGTHALLLVLALGLAALAYGHLRAGSAAKLVHRINNLVPGFPADVRICRCTPAADLKVQRLDGLQLAGHLYGRPRPPQVSPTVLLLHGTTPLGSERGVYRVLASELARRGYLVLTVDFAGYGRSEDPFSLGTPKAIRQEPDALSGLLSLKALPGVDLNRIFVVGHSLGARAALAAGLHDPAVRGIALIGPPRRDPELLFDQRSVDYFYERESDSHRQIFGTVFPDWYTKGVYNADRIATSIETFVPLLEKPGHKPLLLMDASLERLQDLAYLADYYRRIAPPKVRVTVQGSNHWANTVGMRGVALYDRRIVRRTVDVLDGWMRHVSKDHRPPHESPPMAPRKRSHASVARAHSSIA